MQATLISIGDRTEDMKGLKDLVEQVVPNANGA